MIGREQRMNTIRKHLATKSLVNFGLQKCQSCQKASW